MEETPALHSIDGTVDAVIFQNEENGYTVLRVWRWALRSR